MFNTSKIQKCKQFTTFRGFKYTITILCSIRQRYKNASNSQQGGGFSEEAGNCVQYVKDTKMQAIHNYKNLKPSGVELCSIRQRYKNASNSQPGLWQDFLNVNCVQYVKDTKMQAIHNKFWVTKKMLLLCSIRQRYKNASNSQHLCTIQFLDCTVFNTSKIQKCKQFTTKLLKLFSSVYCVQYVKDTKMQAIHNKKEIQEKKEALCSIRQRYKNASNSQLSLLLLSQYQYCVQYVKDTKMQAIHN